MRGSLCAIQSLVESRHASQLVQYPVKHRQKGGSVKAIAKEVGINESTAHRWINRAGLRGQGGHSVKNEKLAAEAVRLYGEGMNVSEVMAQMSKGYYSVAGWLRDAGIEIRSGWDRKDADARQRLQEAGSAARQDSTNMAEPGELSERTGYSEPRKDRVTGMECAAVACERLVYNRTRKYCSDKCRRDSIFKRGPSPELMVTFTCETCGDEKTRLRRKGKTDRFCSKECAQKHNMTKEHFAGSDSLTVFDSRWEMAVYSVLSFVEIEVVRFDRTNCVKLPTGNFYGPDLTLPRLGIHLKVKGMVDEDDQDRWAAFREHVGPLAVLHREEIDHLRRLDKAEAEQYLRDLATV